MKTLKEEEAAVTVVVPQVLILVHQRNGVYWVNVFKDCYWKHRLSIMGWNHTVWKCPIWKDRLWNPYERKWWIPNWKELWDTKQTILAYSEEISTDPWEGQSIKALTTIKQPKHSLEVGMFVGYGRASMLEGSHHRRRWSYYSKSIRIWKHGSRIACCVFCRRRK